MPNPNTLTVSRIELKRILSSYGVAERSMSEVFASMERLHRHVNIIQFINLLEKAGLGRDRIVNVFRHMGMDDVLIGDALNMADESKINAETGRLYKATVELG
ncbi:MAG: hypothetical protein M1160_02800 [Candidatus Marsarchaeota archaeon]|jgi:hypothetical protein|nr:hypothetical protein [Candidatus Marsarchaeota archaeon]MCL5111782.1 hypothetical protein [Candidatus Marsarchaeota archaeon]